MNQIYLKPGREKSVENRHPWIFSGAISRIRGNPVDGEIVPVFSADGQFLARGYLNQHSQITIRLLTWDQEEPVDRSFWKRRLTRALDARSELIALTSGYRLVHAEADGIPGLVVDRYGEWVVVQCLTLGIELRKAEIAQILGELLSDIQGVYERSDVDVRKKEGLKISVGPLFGSNPPKEIAIREGGLEFLVDVYDGHKTGFYLDQRENRAILGNGVAGAELLNCFSYTGAFSVYAARGNAAQITNIDTSLISLTWARRHMEANGFSEVPAEYLEADVFKQLRKFRDQGRQFDVIILDPPKFAHSQRGLNRATHGYKDINLLAMRLLRPGGHLYTFSCSGLVSPILFQKILFGAALDAKRDVQIIRTLTQGIDHPILLAFPESAYLKGVCCRVW